ncbi:DUF1045 domain-containing protein [Primorskyibacter sp. S87]|uniref:DUF1045 domain-containing protein n=1 Tax=Primorskyibacter sp. S87 TaxID=3415126 RepID=UPI003C7CCAD3
MSYRRFAVYYLPHMTEEWVRYCIAWLGWDAETGRSIEHPPADGLDLKKITEAPRRYGLHATLKPPFRLAENQSAAGLQDQFSALCTSLPPVMIERLEIRKLGRFLALCPAGDCVGISDLAAACVRELDRFRAPLLPSELEKRRASGLTARQEGHLVRWGYPHVMDLFRFHITLTEKLGKPELRQVREKLRTDLEPLLQDSIPISDLALMGEDIDGRFHLIRRETLQG